jgi:hypothetical protein
MGRRERVTKKSLGEALVESGEFKAFMASGVPRRSQLAGEVVQTPSIIQSGFKGSLRTLRRTW